MSAVLESSLLLDFEANHELRARNFMGGMGGGGGGGSGGAGSGGAGRGNQS